VCGAGAGLCVLMCVSFRVVLGWAVFGVWLCAQRLDLCVGLGWQLVLCAFGSVYVGSVSRGAVGWRLCDLYCHFPPSLQMSS
jgi:hypothetical protein